MDGSRANHPHSVSQRFFITLVAQTSKSAFSFLTGLVVARGLGPVEYGNLAFLLGSFAGLRLLLDMSVSNAFFTLAAQRQRGIKFYFAYVSWAILFEIALPLLFIALLLPDHVVNVLWQSQARPRIWLAFLASTGQYLFWPQVIQLGEVVRRTLIAQTLTILISVGQFVTVIILYFLGLLSLELFLFTTAIAFLVGGGFAFFFLPRPWRAGPKESFTAIATEFVDFCRPLAFSYALQALQGWVEVWLIQHYAGSKQQGYYALGMQISQIGLLATTALQNIFWREVAELEAAGNHARVHQVYLQTSRALLAAAAAPTILLIFFTPQVVDFALGHQYREAVPAVAVLFLYPLTQCLGTLAFVIFSAMKRTRVLATFAGLIAVLNMVGAYFALAPSSSPVPGFSSGALGMAIKIVLLAFVYLILLENWIHKHRGWRGDWPYRLRLLGIIFGISAIARLSAGMIFASERQWLMVGSGCVIFGSLALVTAYLQPELLGVPPHIKSKVRARFQQFLGSR